MELQEMTFSNKNKVCDVSETGEKDECQNKTDEASSSNIETNKNGKRFNVK